MMCMLLHEKSLCISIPELKAQPRRSLCNVLVVGVPLGSNSYIILSGSHGNAEVQDQVQIEFKGSGCQATY